MTPTETVSHPGSSNPIVGDHGQAESPRLLGSPAGTYGHRPDGSSLGMPAASGSSMNACSGRDNCGLRRSSRAGSYTTWQTANAPGGKDTVTLSIPKSPDNR